MIKSKLIIVISVILVLIGIAMTAYQPEGNELIDKSIFVVLIAGLCGLGIGIVYLIKNRVKAGP